MARSSGKSDSSSSAIPDLIPDLKGKVPTLEDLMRPPYIPPWLRPLPPPQRKPNPFPVPIVPSPPIEVDPPSRPPEYMFGPPYITQAPAEVPLATHAFPIPFVPVASRGLSGGILGMMERAGVIDPSALDVPPAGGLVGILQDYLRSNRERRD